ncbi:CHAT domain-containing protein [Streptomyces sp. NPDC051963]|uniref:CHAT domain-containing protein n=1 Tax=Streptomyces sp. NPDC051963 TaxID=3365678 RepID=UPI0037D1273D
MWRRRKTRPSYQSRKLAELGMHWLERYDRGGGADNLDQAATCFELALANTPDHDPERPTRLIQLGLAYRERFGARGVLADLDRAIGFIEQAVESSPDDEQLTTALSNLGLAHRERYRHGGLGADLDRAIAYLERVLTITRAPDPDRAGILSNLGGAHLYRFETGGAAGDLDQSIRCQEQAVALTPEGHARGAVRTSNLGLAHLTRYRLAGATGDLDRAIACIGRAVAVTRDGDPALAHRLSNLGVAHRERYERHGAAPDLDRAIALLEQAGASLPDGHPDAPALASNLGRAFVERFESGGVLADLDRAIELDQQALPNVPEGHIARSTILANLGVAHQLRHRRSGALSQLDHAIGLLEEALAASPDGHFEQPIRLAELGHAHLDRFATAGALVDLQRAIVLYERALAEMPEEHAKRPGILSDLASAYVHRYERGEETTDLERAIGLLEHAVATAPEGHARRPIFLTNLSHAHLLGLDSGALPPDDRALRTLVQDVASVVGGAPQDRVWVGRSVGTLAHAMGEHATAVQVLDAAVALLPAVTARDAAWSDQEHRLGSHLGLVSEAVAAHCAVGDPTGALEVAELGRGVLLAAQLDSRTDLTDLGKALPDLATEFRRVRDELNTPTPGPTQERARAWSRHDELLLEIRRNPAFRRFLLPPRLTDLRTATADGTVVMVNSGRQRGDAILLGPGGDPLTVPLPDLVHSDVHAYGEALLEAIHETGGFAGVLRRNVLPKILGWLWDTIVEPVVRALPATGPQPRVWWLPTGLIGLFPLHAAGHPGRPGALDAVVSSYTSTLRALAHAHARPTALTRRQLVVALARTPGLHDLPGSIAEADNLHSRAPDAPLLSDEDATVGQVLAHLPESTWAHFACHAGANLSAPSEGGLRLYDGTLTIPEISRLQLADAELAYLSACSTAHRGWQHAEESIHLASAFQLAGFRHVIATLWPLADDIAATAAHAFYRALPPSPTAVDAAQALHQVAHALRDRHPTQPDLWAPLIHSGP